MQDGKDKPVENGVLRTVPVQVAANLPLFAGHFPGKPLVPAALQLEWMLGAIPCDDAADAAWTVHLAKFMKPLEPGASANIVVTRQGDAFRTELHSAAGLHSLATFIRDQR